MARTGIGIDIGNDAIRVIAGVDKKGVFHVRHAVVAPLPPGASDNPKERAEILRAALAATSLKGAAMCGLTGRDVVIRYNQVPAVPDWQLRQLMDFEIQEMITQSGEELAADFNIIPVASDVSEDDTILLALAKPGILDAHVATLSGAGASVRGFTPNAVALYNAWRKTHDDEGVQMIVNVGAKNTDITLVKDGDLLFARNLSGGGELFDEALRASFNVSAPKARKLKEEMADVGPFDRGRTLTAQEEKVSRALSGATGQLFSMIQSSIMFARSQTGQNDLRVDQVLLTGGGGRLKGLDRYLASNMGVPVTAFDPFEALDCSEVEDELDAQGRALCAAALGLALAGAYDDCYSIEILPASIKKARRFKERTVFTVLAALIVVAYLGVFAWRSKEDFASASKDAKSMAAASSNLKRDKDRYAAGVENHNDLARKLQVLEERALPSKGIARALALIQKHLPPDLYVTSIKHSQLAEAGLGITGSDPRPVVVVEGQGREGVQGLAGVFNRFMVSLSADELVPPNHTTSPTSPGSGEFKWTVKLNFSESLPSEIATTEVDEEEGA